MRRIVAITVSVTARRLASHAATCVRSVSVSMISARFARKKASRRTPRSRNSQTLLMMPFIHWSNSSSVAMVRIRPRGDVIATLAFPSDNENAAIISTKISNSSLAIGCPSFSLISSSNCVGVAPRSYARCSSRANSARVVPSGYLCSSEFVICRSLPRAASSRCPGGCSAAHDERAFRTSYGVASTYPSRTAGGIP